MKTNYIYDDILETGSYVCKLTICPVLQGKGSEQTRVELVVPLLLVSGHTIKCMFSGSIRQYYVIQILCCLYCNPHFCLSKHCLYVFKLSSDHCYHVQLMLGDMQNSTQATQFCQNVTFRYTTIWNNAHIVCFDNYFSTFCSR